MFFDEVHYRLLLRTRFTVQRQIRFSIRLWANFIKSSPRKSIFCVRCMHYMKKRPLVCKQLLNPISRIAKVLCDKLLLSQQDKFTFFQYGVPSVVMWFMKYTCSSYSCDVKFRNLFADISVVVFRFGRLQADKRLLDVWEPRWDLAITWDEWHVKFLKVEISRGG